jgi:hypothetical protein
MCTDTRSLHKGDTHETKLLSCYSLVLKKGENFDLGSKSVQVEEEYMAVVEKL